MSDEITVYWSPANFTEYEEQWSYLYPEPILLDDNTIAFKSNIEDNFKLPVLELKQIAEATEFPDQNRVVPSSSIIPIFGSSHGAPENYVGLRYNMGWMLFADEPLVAEVQKPANDLPLSQGELVPQKFDIGRTFRPITTSYNTPVNSTRFKVKVDDELIRIKFYTDKKIVFKRYILSIPLQAIAQELNNLENRYRQDLHQADHYSRIESAKIPEIVKYRINQQLVE